MAVSIAELFARLEFKVDKLSEKRVDDALEKRKKKIGKFSKNVGRLLRQGAVAAGAALSGAFVAGAKDAIEFNKALTRFEIDSQGAAGNIEEFRQRIFKLSRATGVAKEELLAAAAAFTEGTGKGELAGDAMQVVAKSMVASGASASELSKVIVALNQNLGIAPKQFEQGLAVLAQSGKEGAVELRNMASELPSLTAQFQLFGTTGIEGTARLASGLQLIKKEFGTASEAATGMSNLMNVIISRGGKLEKAGIRVFKRDKSGKKTQDREDLAFITKQLKVLEAADPDKFIKAFGRQSGARRALGAVERVTGEWASLQKKVKGATNLTDDFGKATNSEAGKAVIAWNEAKVSFAEAFTPERIQAITKAFVAMLKVVTKIADAIVGIGEFLGESAAKLVTTTPESVLKERRKQIRRKRLKATGFGPQLKQLDLEKRAARGDKGAKAKLKGKTPLTEAQRSFLDPKVTKREALGEVAQEAARRNINRGKTSLGPSIGAATTAINVTINAPNAKDPKEIANEVKKQMIVVQDNIARTLANLTGAGA